MTLLRPQMSLVKKAFGVIGSASCLLVGGFIVLVSGAALLDGGETDLIYVFGAVGVIMMLMGLLLLHGMTRRPVERPDHDDPSEDEGW